MSDKTWKATERKIAELLGGKRRGSDFRGDTGGKTDIILPGFAIEVKQSKRPTFGLMVSAIEQAIRNREKPTDVSFAVIHKEGVEYKDSLVIMKLDEFIKQVLTRYNKGV